MMMMKKSYASAATQMLNRKDWISEIGDNVGYQPHKRSRIAEGQLMYAVATPKQFDMNNLETQISSGEC